MMAATAWSLSATSVELRGRRLLAQYSEADTSILTS
jgi:hypothetical protein